MKQLMMKKSIAVLVAAFAITMMVAVPMAWSIGITPGGNTNINEQEIANISQYEIEKIIGAIPDPSDPPVPGEPPLPMVDPGDLISPITDYADDVASAVEYIVGAVPPQDGEIEPDYKVDVPTVTPTLDLDDLGLTYDLGDGYVKVKGTETYILRVQQAVEDNQEKLDPTQEAGEEAEAMLLIVGQIPPYASDVVGYADGYANDALDYVMVVEGQLEDLAGITEEAIEAIAQGTWDNSRVEVCVVVDDNGQNVFFVGVGPIGGAPSSNPNSMQCPGTMPSMAVSPVPNLPTLGLN